MRCCNLHAPIQITRLRGSTETAKQVCTSVNIMALAHFFLLAQRRRTVIYELLLIVGLPVLIMALCLLFYIILLNYINSWKQP